MEGKQKTPLILMLHGFKSNMNDLFALKDFIDPRFTVVSLQAPHMANQNQYKWYDLMFSSGGNIQSNLPQASESVELLANFVDAAVDQFQADEDQVYLLGFSQGAMMSLYLALSKPQKIAGAAILSGKAIEGLSNHTSDDSEALSNLSLLVTHGKKDEVINIDTARSMEKMLKNLSVGLSYKEYDMGHQISKPCLKDISQWLKNQIDSKTK
ncbi:MAG: alpha/beta hydrolase [Chitinophagales bacterium]